MASELTTTEEKSLARREAIIERGLHTFIAVGRELLAIRDEKLYRAAYDTFENYCRERWGMSRIHAHRLIESAQVAENLLPIGNIPSNEAQARPLAQLTPEQQKEAWTLAVETAPDGKLTAAHVQNVVNEFLAPATTLVIPAPKYAHVSDDSYEWYTPAEYIEAARRVMGRIDVDPASSDSANETVKAKTYYTKQQDGLTKSWPGMLYLNPPYCMPDIELFTDRAVALYQAGEVKQAVILTNNSTDSAWFHALLECAGVACLTRGRVKYWGPNSAQARQGQVFFHLGESHEEFCGEFAQFGKIVKTE